MQHSSAKKGFLLIELLVALSIFSVVMLVSTTSLLSLLDANYKARSLKAVTDNLNFAMENMSRNIRTGSTYYCGTGIDDPSSTSLRDCSAGDIASMTDGAFLAVWSGDGLGRIDYYYHPTLKRIQRRVIPNGESAASHPFVDITAPEVEITGFQFYVTNTSRTDNAQPVVRILLRGRTNIRGVLTQFNLQTTVTQRLIDV